MPARRAGTGLVLGLTLLTACSSAATRSGGASAFSSAAVISGPVTTGRVVEPLTGIDQHLASHGYVEEEYFVSGSAHAFSATATPADGHWVVRPTSSAPYETRVVVRRPSDPTKFNGTVVVEWMNVSAGESAPEWDYLNPLLMRDGFAYVGVTAQAIAVQGGTPILGRVGGSGSRGDPGAQASGGLIRAEPTRYAALHHPGDQYALDMFDQIGRAVRASSPRLVGRDGPVHVVAAGESQSAFYLTTYADAIEAQSHTFDGIFIHSRGGGAAPLDGSSIRGATANAVRIRTDLAVPVFIFETQTDLIQLGFAPARQPDTNRIRTWEVAGTSHADAYLVGPAVSLLGCTQQVNDGPQHEVAQAAFNSFNAWVTRGKEPPTPAPFELSPATPPALELDAHGNVIGGVRTPWVDVPTSTLSGAPPPGVSPLCGLFGSTRPFPPATLAGLYHDQTTFLHLYEQSLDAATRGGYLLPADGDALLARARQIAIP